MTCGVPPCLLGVLATREYAARLGERQSGGNDANKRTTVYSRARTHTVARIPQSIAVIGASTRAGSFGERVLHNMRITAADTIR